MITKMTGVLNRVLDEEIRLQVGPLEYQILVPEYVRRHLQLHGGEQVTLHLMEYLEGNQMSNRWIPRKIGFLSETEIEFFDLFCTVDKVGPRKALKALSRSIKEIASAIQREDAKWLGMLPGIGKATAEQIVTALKRKVTKFSVMAEPSADGEEPSPSAVVGASMIEDAYVALLSLGLSPIDARSRIDAILTKKVEFETVQDLIALAFKQD